MQAIILQIVGLLIITTLIVLFFSKPNVDNVETKTYSKMIGLNFMFICVGILTYAIAKLTENLTFIGILQKLYMSILALLNMYSMHYCISIYDKDNKYGNVKKGLFALTILTIILVIVLPLNVIYEGDLLDGEGLSYDAVMFHTVLSFIFFIVTAVYQGYKKKSIKKIFPFIVLILLYIASFVIREYYRELIFEGFFYSYILFIMFNTIENPDVKMAKELAFQKQLTETSSNKTMDLLDNMAKELKSSLQKLESFGKKKIDKENAEELYEEMNDFQRDSIKLSEKISGVLDLATVKGVTEISENKYETYDMVDKLKQLLIVDSENKNSLNVVVKDNMPPVLYGDDNNVIKIVLYFYNYISSITDDSKLLLDISSLQVGRFSRLKFKFTTTDLSINDYIDEDRDTDRLAFKRNDDINYQIIDNLIKKFNGKITIIENETDTVVELAVDQRLLTEYEILSNRDENKNIKVKYNDYSGKRILIVDNNNVKIKEMKTLLKPYNVDVLSANSQNQMNEILGRDETFDLIFIDDIIPHFEFNEYSNEIVKSKESILNHIRLTAKYSITTVIMLNPTTKHKEQEYLDYGFNDYILKPVNKNNLDKILNKYFDKE